MENILIGIKEHDWENWHSFLAIKIVMSTDLQAWNLLILMPYGAFEFTEFNPIVFFKTEWSRF